MEIVIYSTPICPRCKVLKAKLEKKGINYIEEQNIEKMRELGIDSVPFLQVDGSSLMDFSEANKWINEQEGN